MTAVTIDAEQLIIKETGKICHTSNDNWAKLKYYLNCVDCVINYGIPSNLKDYDNYINISFDDKNVILMLAEVMNPDLFEKNHVFVNDILLCGDSQNKFYDISYTKLAAAATKEFLIAGKLVATLKIMTYCNRWKNENYYQPMQELQKRLSDIHHGNAEKYKPKNSSIACLLI